MFGIREPSHTAWGMPGADVSAESWTGVDCNVVDEFVQVCHQGIQPYVNVEGYHDTPYMSVHESGTFGIDLGVDVGLSSAVEPRVMSTPGAHLARKKQHGSAVKRMGAEDVDDAARSGPHFRHHRGLKTDILNISAVLEDKHAEDFERPGRGKISDVTRAQKPLTIHLPLQYQQRSVPGQKVMDMDRWTV